MVQFWSALASRETRLMTHVLQSHFPPVLANATYVTYLRCHDDIGWAVTDEDAAAVGLSGAAHRAFLSDFYEGGFPGSFARGALFQVNEATGDKRISGSCASLAGLERALEAGDATLVDGAIDRILMGHALIASFGGIPLIYMGDEIALLNDPWPTARCPSRPMTAAGCTARRWTGRAPRRAMTGGDDPEARVLAGLRHILARRAAMPAFHAGHPTLIRDAGQDGLFCLSCAPRRAGGWCASTTSPRPGARSPPTGAPIPSRTPKRSSASASTSPTATPSTRTGRTRRRTRRSSSASRGQFVGHGRPLIRPPESEQLDYEGEIALVIGTGGRRIAGSRRL
jgi:hypothetical protein